MTEPIQTETFTMPDGFFKLSLDHSVLPVIWFTRNANIIYANQAAGDYLGYTPEELMQMKLFDINPVLTPANWEIACEKIQAQQAATVKTIHRTRDGTHLEVEIRRNRIVFNDTSIFQLNIVSIGADNTVELHSEMELVFEAFPDLIIKLDKDDKVVLFKAGKGAILSGTPDSYKGKSFQEVIPQGATGQVSEALTAARMQNTIQTVSFCSNAEKNKWNEARLIPLSHGQILAYVRDISAQKHVEQQLRTAMQEIQKREQIYRTLSMNIPNGFVCMFDREMRYTLVEGDIFKQLPYFGNVKEGVTPAEALPEDEYNAILPVFEQVLMGDTVTYETQGKTTKRHFQITVTPIVNDQGEIDGGLAIGFDIEKLKLTEMELQQRVEQLASLNRRLGLEIQERSRMSTELKNFAEELIRKNHELEQFAYVASHDLQEPLRMVSSYTQLLAARYKGRLDSDADEFIEFAIEGASRMQSLIHGLLNYSRIRKSDLKPDAIDLNRLLEECKKNLALSIMESGAEIICDMLPMVTGDKTQLTQLFQNLISNAVKFRKQDERPLIRIVCSEKDSCWHFRISDNGIGIDYQHRERIFQIFQRLHNRQKYPGTGIGLAICKKIIEQHGGSIWLEPQNGTGTTFGFTLSKQPMSAKSEPGMAAEAYS